MRGGRPGKLPGHPPRISALHCRDGFAALARGI
jgi:hypothetical protein